MNNKKCVYLPDCEKTSIERALRWLFEKSKISGKGVIVFPKKPDAHSVFTQALGGTGVQFVKTLNNNGVYRENGIEIMLLTQTQNRPIHPGNNTPVCAFYPDGRTLDMLSGLNWANEILVAPWVFENDDFQQWIQTWNATELGKKKPKITKSPISDPIVVGAMKCLVESINISSGIIHPSDKDMAVSIFRILRKNGIEYNPSDIKSWMISHGKLLPEHAKGVEKLANDMLEGKRVKGENVLRTDVDWISEWKKEGADF